MRATGARVGRIDRVWLPLGDRELARFLVRQLWVPHGLGERLAAALPRRSGLPAPPRDVAAPAEVPERLAARLTTARRLLAAAAERGQLPAEWAAPSERWILVEDYRDGERFLLALFAADGEGRPRALLKAAPAAADGPARERAALERLAAGLSPELAATVPRVLAFTADASHQGVVLAPLPGRPAYVELQAAWLPRRCPSRHLGAAVRWLARFQRETATGHALSLPEDPEAVGGVGAALAAGDRGVLAWLAEARQRCRERPVALVAGHGDFWIRNLLLAPGDGRSLSGVLDWDGWRPQAPPYRDLFHLLATYARAYPWAGYRRRPLAHALDGAFLAATPLSRAVRQALVEYRRLTGRGAGELRDHFLLWTLESAAEAPAAEATAWLELHRRVRQGERCVFSG